MASQKCIEINSVFIDLTNEEMEQILDSSDEQDIPILNNVYGDPTRFIQIMQNFLSNALKFTSKKGKITIKVSLQEVQEIKSKEQKENYKLAIEKNISNCEDK